MKNLILVCVLAILAACGAPEEPQENQDFPDQVAETDDADTVILSSSYTSLRPEEGYIEGNFGAYTEVNAQAYNIHLGYESLHTFVYHDTGRVMTGLTLDRGFDHYLTQEVHEFNVGPTDGLLAVGCQGDDLYAWDYDSHAKDGTLTISPIEENTWLVAYDLQWDDYELSGAVVVTER